MKTVIILLTILTFLACKKNHNPSNALKDGVEKIIKTEEKKATTKPTSSREITKRLKELETLSAGALESWLPEKLTTMIRKKTDIGLTGFKDESAIIGFYEIGSGSNWAQIQIHVLDGAGQTFSPKVTAQIKMHDLKFNEDINGDSKRTVMYKGLKVHQTYNKTIGSTNLQFIIDQRFSVMVTAINPTLERVWEEIEVLDFDALKNLK